MSIKKEHWYNNPWVVGIGLLFLAPLSSLIIDFFKGVNIFSTLGNWIILFFKILNTPMNLTVFEGLCLFIPMIAFMYFYFNSVGSNSKKPAVIDSYDIISRNLTKSKEDAILVYKAEKIKGLVWTWNYIFNNLLKRYEIKGINPVCPNHHCNNAIIFYHSTHPINGYIYICTKCNTYISTLDSIMDVEVIIEDKIKEKFGYSLAETEVKITPRIS